MNNYIPIAQRYVDLVQRLRTRAEIRRQIPTRKSVQEGQTDRIADLLEEAASAIEELPATLEEYSDIDCNFCK